MAAKAAKALRPGGLLAPFWHVFEPPSEVADAFAAYQALFARAADGIRGVGGFGEPEQWRFDGARTYTRD